MLHLILINKESKCNDVLLSTYVVKKKDGKFNSEN